MVDELMPDFHLGVFKSDAFVLVIDFKGPFEYGPGSLELLQLFLSQGVLDPVSDVIPLLLNGLFELPPLLQLVLVELVAVDLLVGADEHLLTMVLGIEQDLLGCYLDRIRSLVLNDGWVHHNEILLVHVATIEFLLN